jgi:5-methyltetrahydrofolate--homocysteine methyltransferase
MKTTIQAISDAGLRSKVKILIGGAPTSRAYADQIGADGYAETAAGVVALARKVVA